jgi:hypothetical protein
MIARYTYDAEAGIMRTHSITLDTKFDGRRKAGVQGKTRTGIEAKIYDVLARDNGVAKKSNATASVHRIRIRYSQIRNRPLKSTTPPSSWRRDVRTGNCNPPALFGSGKVQRKARVRPRGADVFATCKEHSGFGNERYAEFGVVR